MTITKKQPKQWRNWSGLHRVTPQETILPETPDDVLEVVNQAMQSGRKVRPIGSGHSFTGAAVAPDIQLDLTRLSGLVGIDRDLQQVTLRAGTKLWQIPGLIRPLGLAMQNLGDINRQSILGAVSTSTHGTGLGFGGLGSQVVGVSMVTGKGEAHTVTVKDGDDLDALRVTLGAYGVITEVTLQLVPDFDLHVVEELRDLDDVLANWRDINEANDHFEFFWFGHSNQVVAKTSTRLKPFEHERTPSGGIGEFFNDQVVGNGAFAALCQVGRFASKTIPTLNRIATAGWGATNKVKHWSEGFASPRNVHFNEMEYALPFDEIPEVIREIQKLFVRDGIAVTFPIEVRSAAADTGHLATNYGRQTGYIAVHQHVSQNYRPYFTRVEEIFKAHNGRPHWGKMHTLTAEDLADRYPKWEDALKLRDRFDPERIFENDYLRQVFGA